MRKKRQRERDEAAARQGPAATPGVYRPFRELKDKLPVPAAPAPAPAPRRTAPAPDRDASRPPSPEAERRAFESAVSGAAPLAHDTVTADNSAPVPPAEDDLTVAEHFLSAFVGGDVPFDFTDTGEHVQGCVHGLDPRLVLRLRRGDFAVQGHLDLHGLDRHEAKQAVREFVERSRREFKRCVLIVHGRGRGSKDGVAVLRDGIREWLSRGGIGRQVLAFTSARPADGGTGAVYVLLRR